MRIDIILESNNSPETVLKLGKLAEEVGLGGVWVSNMNDSRDPFINFVPLAMATDRIKLGPIAVSPFELHPLKMASSLITLNEMAKGRAQIVVGAGGGTVGAMGLKPYRVVRAVRECVEIIKAAASGEPARYNGEIFKVRWYDATWIEHKPPFIYVGANGPQMLASAARYADGIMMSDFVPERVIWAREHIDPALEEAGRDVAAFPVNNFWAWHVKESKEEAYKEARIWLAVRGTIYDKYIRDVVSDEEAKIVEENIWSFINAYQTKSDVIEGVPDEILNKIIEHGTSASTIADIDREVERMREFKRNGLTEIAIRIYDEPEKSIRLIGEKIAPVLKD
jgi:5,10-methylenetetrahydromethanopterin reductase